MNNAFYRSVVLDTTYVLAADSYLRPTRSGLRDEAHVEAFQNLTTLLCNNYPLIFARPDTLPRTMTPFLYVCAPCGDTQEKSSSVPVKLSTEGTTALYKDIARKFFSLPDSEIIRIANWVRFQFDDPLIVDIFWDGGDQQNERLHEAFSYIVSLSQNSKWFDKWNKAIGRSLPQIGRNSFAASTFASSEHYALAYAFFGFAKGRLYPYQLLKLVPNVNFLPHWLRVRAMPSDSSVQLPIMTEPPPELFPWGVILANITGQLLGSGGPLPDKFGDLIVRLRKSTTKEDPLKKAKEHSEEDDKFLHLENFVIDSLYEIEWIPARRNPKLDKLLRGTVSLIFQLLKISSGIPTDTIEEKCFELPFHASWFDKINFDVERNYRRAKLWNSYADAGIRDAVRQYVFKNRP